MHEQVVYLYFTDQPGCLYGQITVYGYCHDLEWSIYGQVLTGKLKKKV